MITNHSLPLVHSLIIVVPRSSSIRIKMKSLMIKRCWRFKSGRCSVVPGRLQVRVPSRTAEQENEDVKNQITTTTKESLNEEPSHHHQPHYHLVSDHRSSIQSPSLNPHHLPYHLNLSHRPRVRPLTCIINLAQARSPSNPHRSHPHPSRSASLIAILIIVGVVVVGVVVVVVPLLVLVPNSPHQVSITRFTPRILKIIIPNLIPKARLILWTLSMMLPCLILLVIIPLRIY